MQDTIKAKTILTSLLTKLTSIPEEANNYPKERANLETNLDPIELGYEVPPEQEGSKEDDKQ